MGSRPTLHYSSPWTGIRVGMQKDLHAEGLSAAERRIHSEDVVSNAALAKSVRDIGLRISLTLLKAPNHSFG